MLNIDISRLKEYKCQPNGITYMLAHIESTIYEIVKYMPPPDRKDLHFTIYINQETFLKLETYYHALHTIDINFFTKISNIEQKTKFIKTQLTFTDNSITIYVDDNLIDFQFRLGIQLYTSNTDLITLNK